MRPREMDFVAARQILDEVAWLTAHGSHVQAGRKLGELMRSVESHIAFTEGTSVNRATSGPRLTPSEVERLEAQHRRLVALVEEAETYSSRSDRPRRARSLRRLSRSLRAHQRETHRYCKPSL